MKSDNEIQQDVIEQLKWEPFLYASEIGVSVKDGIVTLSGQVDSYLKKLHAEKAARNVKGVKALAEDIAVRVFPTGQKTDAEIATAAFNALKWHSAVRDDKIHISVEEGVVKLDGQVEWEYQREAARIAVANLNGVRKVLNLITISPRLNAKDLGKQIGAAFQRNASIDASGIGIVVEGNNVTLNGSVRSFAERDDAEDAAWDGPGVQHVQNNLKVSDPAFV